MMVSLTIPLVEGQSESVQVNPEQHCASAV